MKNSIPALFRRYLVVLAFALWFGGLTFYALVVIPTAHGVLKSHLRVGFITQGVTHWINAAAVGALVLFLWELVAGWKKGSAAFRLGSWIVMVAAQAALFGLHPVLDQLLDPRAREIVEPDRFYELHRIYLIVTAVQWGAALLHLWLCVRTWGQGPALPAATDPLQPPA